MSLAQYYFLPDVRQGLAAGISGCGPQRAQVPVKMEAQARVKDTENWVLGDIQPQVVELHGPGDMLLFDERIIVRTDPKPDVGDFEPNYFPAIEFADADYAWRFTPAGAGEGTPKLQPWIALIVLVAEQEE